MGFIAEPAVEVVGVKKEYAQGETAVHALAGVDLTVARGSMVAIMGPSGSGKSTLLHIMGALESVTAGEVSIAGKRIDNMNDRQLTLLRRDHIGFVFQFFNLMSTLSAKENILLPALISGEPVRNYAERTEELLEVVGLRDRGDHLPHQLSGGEQQRVAIARALLRKPALILADEPTGNLDSASGEGILELLREVCAEQGHTVVMVTHDTHDASVAGRIVVLNDGVVVGEVEGGSSDAIVEFMRALERRGGVQPLV